MDGVIIQMLLISLMVSLLFIIKPKWSSLILLLTALVLCAKEVFLGQSQLSGYIMSNSDIYAMTGSFTNPGPYGGFIAVCMSILAAFMIKKRGELKNCLLTKILSWIICIVLFAAIATLPVSQSRSAMLGFCSSMLLLGAGTESIRKRAKPILKKYGLLILIGVAVLGTAGYLYKKQSADGRLFMDKMCVKAMFHNGLKGAGIGRFGGAYAETQADYFYKTIQEKGADDLDWSVINEHERITADCPSNPFNEYLLIGVETGLLGMILFIGVIVVSIVISYRQGTVWCYGMTALAVFALFSYPLHLVQFRIMFAVLLAACLADRKRMVVKPVIVSMLLLMLSVVAIIRYPEIKQKKQHEITRIMAEIMHGKKQYDKAVEYCDSIFPMYSNDYRFLFIYGQSLNMTGNYEKSDSVLKMGTEISSDPMFWNVLGNNSLARGMYREAEEYYKRAFYMVPNRLYPLYLLAKLYHAEGDVDAFKKMENKVQSFKSKVELLNAKSLRSVIQEISESFNEPDDTNLITNNL